MSVSIDQVRAVLRRLDPVRADAVGEEESLLDAGIIDSLAMVELLTRLEAEFGVRLDDRDLIPENFDTVRAIRNLIQRRRGGPPGEQR